MHLQLRLVDCLFVESGKDVFPHGSNKSAIFGSENFSTTVNVCRCGLADILYFDSFFYCSMELFDR